MSKTAPEPVHETKKDVAVQFLKSLESKDSKALKYVDPEKYIQHNLHAGDGLPVVRKDGAWRLCHHVLATLLGMERERLQAD